MPRFASIALLVGATALSPSPALAADRAVRPPSAGQLAPDFKLAGQSGKAARLSDARGQKVVLVFYRGYW